MKLIKTLSENIEDEIEDIKKYAKLAIEVREQYPNLAETLYAISKQENEHFNLLHTQVTKIIQDYRLKVGEPPADMMAIYDYLHKKHIEDMADAKRYQDMYLGK